MGTFYLHRLIKSMKTNALTTEGCMNDPDKFRKRGDLIVQSLQYKDIDYEMIMI